MMFDDDERREPIELPRELVDYLDPDWDHVAPTLMMLDGELLMFDGIPTSIAVSPELAGGHADRLARGFYDDDDDTSGAR